MTNAAFSSISDYRDVETLNYYKEALAAGSSVAEAMRSIRYMSRDNARTPMQWNADRNAGFSAPRDSAVRPWIAVNPDYAAVNVEAQEADSASPLHFARAMIKLRRKHRALVYGSFELLAREDGRLFAFIREGEGERLLVEINMSGRSRGGSRVRQLRDDPHLEPIPTSGRDGRRAGARDPRALGGEDFRCSIGTFARLTGDTEYRSQEVHDATDHHDGSGALFNGRRRPHGRSDHDGLDDAAQGGDQGRARRLRGQVLGRPPGRHGQRRDAGRRRGLRRRAQGQDPGRPDARHLRHRGHGPVQCLQGLHRRPRRSALGEGHRSRLQGRRQGLRLPGLHRGLRPRLQRRHPQEGRSRSRNV